MAISNHERVGKALEILTSGLKPFVERELKNTCQQGRFDETRKATAALTRKLGSRAKVARDLGYQLFRGSSNPRVPKPHNALVLAWPDFVKLAQARPEAGPVQAELV